jgi:hypothetical protein
MVDFAIVADFHPCDMKFLVFLDIYMEKRTFVNKQNNVTAPVTGFDAKVWLAFAEISIYIVVAGT